ncbi:cytochrome P450 monooxygenase-like protein [Nemania sp. FL0916]|nr:cytochrome P450 monooxygenase-like protein [Nemania sp. FL0916]
MMENTLSSLIFNWPPVISIILVFALCLFHLFYQRVKYLRQLARFPLLNPTASSGESRKAFLESATQLYQDGYKRFTHTAYRILTSDGEQHIVIPPRLLPEFRQLTDSVVSIESASAKILETRYTHILADLPVVAHLIRAELTPALARINPIIHAKIDEVMVEDMPKCADWTPIPVYMSMVTMVAKITGRIFVGEDLCRNPEYLDSAMNYTVDGAQAQREIKLIHPWLRWIIAPRLASVRRLRERERKAAAFLEPVLQARLNAGSKGAIVQEHDDMLSSFIRSGGSQGLVTASELAMMQLGVIFAAVHTSSDALCNILYDLAVRPDCVEAIREEIRFVMAQHHGVVNSRVLQQMMKLDSFMKESMRLNGPLSANSHRKVIQGFTLSNGQYIPPGATISLPGRAIYLDPANYPDADRFDGLRHYKLRQGGTAKDHARNQFVASNEQNMVFGYGRHSCPGRFFAANEIKMLLARLILDYDFKNEDGSMQRYPNIEIGSFTMPDTTRKLLFKKVGA